MGQWSEGLERGVETHKEIIPHGRGTEPFSFVNK